VALAQAGATVVATGRRKAELDALARECGEDAIEPVAGDLNDAAFVAALARTAGEVDILLANAGILKYAPLMDLTDADCEAMFRTNVLASIRVCQAIARQMIARGRGHIIVMTSIAAREVYRFGSIYCATKFALSAFARSLRIELQGFGIKVTEIAPGTVDTDIRATSDHPALLEALKARTFTGLTAQEVAQAVVYAATAAPNVCPEFIELRPKGSATV
jgi:NADP-dependent 3-hydroxy acid dehydrogenase YdfG